MIKLTPNLPQITFVLGGARSGKSAYAESLVTSVPGPWAYIATAEAFDAEMRERIGHHKARRGLGWLDHETPLEISEVIANRTTELPSLVDCLTLWVSNLMHANRSLPEAGDELVSALKKRIAPCVVVSNEVGLGIVPENALARSFRDEAGRLNQKIAAAADKVVFVAAGLPLMLKG